MNFLLRYFRKAKLNRLRKRYKVGTIVTQFIARDVRRDILVISASRIDERMLTCRVRTNNVLYTTKGLAAEEDFGDVQEISLDDAWKWSGDGWGGLPDGTSLVAGQKWSKKEK